jgi:hypothetical protein
MSRQLEKVDKTIKMFRDYVIQQSRSNLTKGGKNVTKKLYDSLKGDIVTDKGFSIVGFSMDDYGAFQDKGVRGKSSSAKAPNSPFKFGSGTGKKGGLTQGIDKWVRLKGFQFRDKTSGKFMSYQATAFLITRSIFHKGIKPSLFFTKPFEAGYKKYIDVDLVKAFGQDVETMVDYNLKNIK